MDKAQFRADMARLKAGFPSTKLTSSTMSLYWDYFKDIDSDKFKKIVVEILAKEEFFPKIATIRKYLSKGLIAGIPTLLDVINDFRHAVLEHGIYESPVFKYPITHAVVEAIGWKQMCQATMDENSKTFTFRYEETRNLYETCLIEGREFPINTIKGIFAETGEPMQLPSGKTVYTQREGGDSSLGEVLGDIDG